MGEEFIVGDLCPPLCHELWHTIYPSVYALLNGGSLDCGPRGAPASATSAPTGAGSASTVNQLMIKRHNLYARPRAGYQVIQIWR